MIRLQGPDDPQVRPALVTVSVNARTLRPAASAAWVMSAASAVRIDGLVVLRRHVASAATGTLSLRPGSRPYADSTVRLRCECVGVTWLRADQTNQLRSSKSTLGFADRDQRQAAGRSS